jgi:RNA polymerase sigma factor (TIGR02999 family)
MATGEVPDKSSADDLTRILHEAAEGHSGAPDQLLPLVYAHLRAIAEQHMKKERPGHTLQATALVHEAYLRLVGGQQLAWNGRSHFYYAAGEAMRRILVEHARARGRIKRGGDSSGRPARRVPLNVIDLASAPEPEEILMLDAAFRRLEDEDADAARVVRLRLYAGLSVDETAAALGVSPSTVDREWAFARALLHQMMKETP